MKNCKGTSIFLRSTYADVDYTCRYDNCVPIPRSSQILGGVI